MSTTESTRTSVNIVNGKSVTTTIKTTTCNGVTKTETIIAEEDLDNQSTTDTANGNDGASFFDKLWGRSRNVEDSNKKGANQNNNETLPSIEEYRKQALSEINDLRKKHGVTPLATDSALQKLAQEWAERLAKQRRLEHRQNCKYGENVAMASSGQENIMVRLWYDEIQKYPFPNKGNGYVSGTGHFTQLVWKGSSRIGVGVARGGGCTYLVANFDPAGNMQGDYAQNVMPKK